MNFGFMDTHENDDRFFTVRGIENIFEKIRIYNVCMFFFFFFFRELYRIDYVEVKRGLLFLLNILSVMLFPPLRFQVSFNCH